MDKSVEGFFTKNAADGYAAQYDKDHSPRLINLIERFNINGCYKGESVVDIGGGLGFLGKRLDPSIKYTVIDGAFVAEEKRLRAGKWITTDLDYCKFSKFCQTVELVDNNNVFTPIKYDAAFCLETLEHLTNPYNCLAEIKKIVKTNGMIYLSIPHKNVWHNYIYPALMIERGNFEQFLEQMALPIVEYHLWDKGWNAHTWMVRNAPWEESKMLYPKSEQKFVGKTPVEYVNL